MNYYLLRCIENLFVRKLTIFTNKLLTSHCLIQQKHLPRQESMKIIRCNLPVFGGDGDPPLLFPPFEPDALGALWYQKWPGLFDFLSVVDEEVLGSSSSVGWRCVSPHYYCGFLVLLWCCIRVSGAGQQCLRLFRSSWSSCRPTGCRYCGLRPPVVVEVDLRSTVSCYRSGCVNGLWAVKVVVGSIVGCGVASWQCCGSRPESDAVVGLLKCSSCGSRLLSRWSGARKNEPRPRCA